MRGCFFSLLLCFFKDPYLALLVKLYRFLARRTGSSFNETVLKRLFMSQSSRAPVSTSRLAKELKGKSDKVIAVTVGTVTYDPRLAETPKMTVCALRFTRQARKFFCLAFSYSSFIYVFVVGEQILKAGGQTLTFDQLAVQRPRGQNTILLRGPRKARDAYKHFGAPGTPGSKTQPKVAKKNKGLHKKEQARGRRKSRGYKN
jgi:large subunit ribosomal protein L18e